MSTPSIKITPLCLSVHHDDESPILGKYSTHVSIEDEAAGPFIVLRQPRAESGEVRLEPDELDVVIEAAQQLLKLNSQ